MSVEKLRHAIHHIQSEIGKKELPAYWIEFLLLVAEKGDEGITTKEAAEILDMTQGIASRTVKLMTKHYNPATKEVEGFDVLTTTQDMEYRHRMRVYLTEKGKKIVEEAVRFMT